MPKRFILKNLLHGHPVRCWFLGIFLLMFASQATAFFEENNFQKAREAYASKNIELLNQYVLALKSKDYLLTPYAEYWLMLLKLENASDSEVLNFLENYATYPFANRLRGEWLKKLAKQASWGQFFAQYPQYLQSQGEDVALQCDYLYGQASNHQGNEQGIDVSQVKKLWFTSQDQPSQCNQLFDLMINNGTLTVENIYERLRLALFDGKPALAKGIVEKLPNFEPLHSKMIERAYQTPAKFISLGRLSFKSRFGAELNVVAFDRLARENASVAAEKLQSVQLQFEPAFRSLAWMRVGYQAARAQDGNAMRYFSEAKNLAAPPVYLQDALAYREIFAWRTRAALRDGDWQAVLSSIELMAKKQSEEAVWRYWKGRALKEIAMNTQSPSQESMQILTQLFTQLAKERHYYGWLAAEELEENISANPIQAHAVLPEEVDAIANMPEMKRAIALKNLDMRWEAKMEWQAATRNFSDQALLAAATYAQKLKWYDVSISTADATKQTHQFDLRYPTPYRDLFKYAADDEHLDEAWVYGLTRQESRFVDDAKSVVGAAGLMQLMPDTAKWAAKRKGLIGYRHSMIHDLRTNIALGAFYMRYTLDLMDGQAVLASAAYNAGPSRAKRWMADTPMEAAIYIESIPFGETRNYVQKVMANAHLYAPRLGTKIQSLKARLGMIPARGELSNP